MTRQVEATKSTAEVMLSLADSPGPRLTEQDINDAVRGLQYYVFPHTTVTACCLTLQNGYNVIGTSACVSLENFDEGIGRALAYKDALRKVWELEGYLLRDKLAKGLAGRTELP